MEVVLAITAGILYASGFYLMLRRSIVKLILGFLLLSNATNLLVFVAGGLSKGVPPFAGKEGDMADPLPQALLLTAIVIGLGMTAFFLVIKYRYYKTTKTEDLDNPKENQEL